MWLGAYIHVHFDNNVSMEAKVVFLIKVYVTIYLRKDNLIEIYILLILTCNMYMVKGCTCVFRSKHSF